MVCHIRSSFGLILLGLVLGACSMTSPSRVNVAPITVEEDQHVTTIPLYAINDVTLRELATHYERYGEGPIKVLVLYAPSEPILQAEQKAAELGLQLEQAGIQDIQVSTLPVHDPSKQNTVMIDYVTLAARAPLGCEPHPADSRGAIAESDDGFFNSYRFGCGVDQYLVGQVARPADFLGSNTMSPVTAERAAGRLDDYRSGKDLKELKAINASELN